MKQIYKIENLKQEYVNRTVLDIDNLEIFEGEIVGVVGSNGCGKSTLLRHLAFLEEPKEGAIYYKNITNPPLHIKREISILLPEPYLLKRSIKENLLYGLKVRGQKGNFKEKIKEVMNLVGLQPEKFLHRQWSQLSSGETERIALASRLILKPKVLLLDEPTNSLDFAGIPLFTEAIRYANKNWGTTIVIASHDLSWLSSLATRKINLHFGKPLEFSTANILFGDWEKFEGGCVFCFSDSQKIYISDGKKIDNKKGVIVDSSGINIYSNKETIKGENILNATVKEISYIENGSNICIKVTLGSNTLEVVQSLKDFNKNRLFPAQNVYIQIKEEYIKNL